LVHAGVKCCAAAALGLAGCGFSGTGLDWADQLEPSGPCYDANLLDGLDITSTDEEHAVEVFIDRTLWDAPALQCHPLVNTSTLVISHEGMEKFFQATGHEVKVVEVPSREISAA
jgi:hypothetical protein